MTQRKSPILAVVLGVLGAGLAVALLLFGQTGSIIPRAGALTGGQLPILVVGAGAGFVMGVIAAIVWSIIRWLFVPGATRV